MAAWHHQWKPGLRMKQALAMEIEFQELKTLLLPKNRLNGFLLGLVVWLPRQTPVLSLPSSLELLIFITCFPAIPLHCSQVETHTHSVCFTSSKQFCASISLYPLYTCLCGLCLLHSKDLSGLPILPEWEIQGCTEISFIYLGYFLFVGLLKKKRKMCIKSNAI